MADLLCMTRFGLLLTTLAACGYQSTPEVATFHGSVGHSITHVMAVSPLAGDLVKVIAPAVDGTFSIDVEPGRPWALVFLDANQRGSDMVHGILRADTLDTFVPVTGGDIDLGEISIDNREATMAGSSEDLDNALGVSRRTLATLGGIDDIALRYANPDIDGDGLFDTFQARLDIHGEYTIHASGRAATADDFVGNAVSIDYQHVGTGLYARLPDGFGTVDHADADVTFDQPYYGYFAGAESGPIAAGQPVDELTFGDDRTFGVFCRADHAIPSGTYSFRSGAHTLDFSFVRPPIDMKMNRVMPRLHFVPVDPACTSNCRIDRIDFAWARRTYTGWTQLTDEEASILRPAGSIDFVFADAGTRRYELPIGTATGSVPWKDSQSTGDILYGNLTFQSRPGMKLSAHFGDSTLAPRPIGIPEQR